MSVETGGALLLYDVVVGACKMFRNLEAAAVLIATSAQPPITTAFGDFNPINQIDSAFSLKLSTFASRRNIS
jgi:hypothetical protein